MNVPNLRYLGSYMFLATDVISCLATLTGDCHDEYHTAHSLKALWVNFSWWRHKMEPSSVLLAICAGNSPVTGEFPAQRPVTRSFDVFFDLHLNPQLSKQWRHRCFETPSRSFWSHCNVMLVYQLIWLVNSRKFLIWIRSKLIQFWMQISPYNWSLPVDQVIYSHKQPWGNPTSVGWEICLEGRVSSLTHWRIYGSVN